MKIWVDADACPNAIKTVLFRAAERLEMETILVANHHLRVPPSAHVTSVQVPGGFDVADDAIASRMAAGDLVITADVPLAAEVVRLGGTALNPRGTLYTPENIHDHLARRDLLEQLRETGMHSSTQSAPGKAEVQAFANQLDRFLHARRP
ncbi:MAG: YaiI/YqxD family protein [Pseudomonadota bacterium]